MVPANLLEVFGGNIGERGVIVGEEVCVAFVGIVLLGLSEGG